MGEVVVGWRGDVVRLPAETWRRRWARPLSFVGGVVATAEGGAYCRSERTLEDEVCFMCRRADEGSTGEAE